jgi:hypothetical protein
VPGYAAQPRPGRPRGIRGGRSRFPDFSGDSGLSLEDDIAGAALGAAAKFVGRAIGRRMEQTLNQKVLPAMAANQQEMLQRQIAIAERHPDVCACLNDQVIFLAGGQRALPMPNVATLTVEQSDALVAQLRNG